MAAAITAPPAPVQIEAPQPAAPDELGSLLELPLEVEALLDSRLISVAELLALRPGNVIRLDRSAGENVRIHVGGVHLADGDIAASDAAVCVRVTEFRERS
jgi:flagellar motor switch protein FliN/FliY